MRRNKQVGLDLNTVAALQPFGRPLEDSWTTFFARVARFLQAHEQEWRAFEADTPSPKKPSGRARVQAVA